MTERFSVQIDADHFDRLARPTQPLTGVAEMIWNALDAEAEVVAVLLDRTDLDAVDVVVVTDDGHGMTRDEALRDFRRLGGSWKKARHKSKNDKRTLHGKEGAGRFRAFAVGRTVEWVSVSRSEDGGLRRIVVSGTLESSEFTVSDEEVLATGDPGTRVRIEQPREHVNRLLADHALIWLLTRFAVYLVRYPSVSISYDGTRLDPSSILARETEIELAEVDHEEYGSPHLRIMEWKPDAATIEPSLLLCDENGVALSEITEGIQASSGIRFTAYATWRGFGAHAREIELANLGHDVLAPAVEAAKNAIAAYVAERLSEQRADVLARWKAEHVYPYVGEPANPAEEQERKVFDVVAVTAAPAVAKDPKSAKLSLRLIKESLSHPGALQRVLKEVLDLTPDQLEDFDRLLQRTTLVAIIQTSKLVTDRLQFLSDLESILFDSDKKKLLLERSQLHRILANGRTWLFGEEYSLVVDDGGLTKVLQAHRKSLGEIVIDDEPVTDTSGATRIIDLMLSKARMYAKGRDHLVVELKRPGVKLGQEELNQITNYAVAVIKDDRFKAADVRWEFWLVGDELDDVLESVVNQANRPSGLAFEGGNYRIWVRRWAELLEENRQGLHFYREHLQFKPEEQGALDEVLAKYLPKKEDAE